MPIDGYTPGLDEAAIAADREMTFAVWRRLGELLEEQEISQFVRWARELAPSVRVDPSGLDRPTSD